MNETKSPGLCRLYSFHCHPVSLRLEQTHGYTDLHPLINIQTQ